MRVFISWSGELSKKLAEATRDWLLNTLQYVDPFFSPEDIEKSAKWDAEIRRELEASSVCIIALTRESLDSKGITFEARAIFKSTDKPRLCTVLFDLEPTDPQGPLERFQATRFSKDGVHQLLKTINANAKLEEALSEPTLDLVFDKWWPDLDRVVKDIMKDAGSSTKVAMREPRDLLQEVYGISLQALSLPLRILHGIERRIRNLQRERQEKLLRAELARTKGYSFTCDWVSDDIQNWLAWLAPFRNEPSMRMLEIGSYEGRSAIWYLENILSDPQAHLTCIDPFNVWPSLFRFDHNLRVSGQVNKVTKMQGHSEDILPGLAPSSMDIIYVDGSHRACDVLMDGVLAWRLLKPGGVMIFDDYLWEPDFVPSRRPQMAIDLFLEMFAGQYTLVGEDYQVAIRKQS